MNVEIYEALVSAGVSEDKAKAAAIAAVKDNQALLDKIEAQDKKIIGVTAALATVIPIIITLLTFLLKAIK